MNPDANEAILSFDFSEPDLLQKIRRALKTDAGACRVVNMPCSEDNQALEAFALTLGNPLYQKRNINGGMTFRVEAIVDDPVPPYANTTYQFAGHTDCSDFFERPDTVLLLCESPAESGGESLLSPLAKILPLLSLDTLLGLQQSRFLFRDTYGSVLYQKDGRTVIRYNRVLMDLFRQVHKVPREPELEECLNDLDQAIYASQSCFQLKTSDCLILNNYTTVHGRLSFDGGTRLLKRVRLRLK